MAVTRIDELPELSSMDDIDLTLLNSQVAGSGLPVTQHVKGQTIQTNLLNDYELSDTITFILDGGGATVEALPEYNANTGFETGNATSSSTRTLS